MIMILVGVNVVGPNYFQNFDVEHVFHTTRTFVENIQLSVFSQYIYCHNKNFVSYIPLRFCTETTAFIVPYYCHGHGTEDCEKRC